MRLKTILMEYLRNRKKSKVALLELQGLFSGDTDYRSFAEVIKELEKESILIPVKNHGRDGKGLGLCNMYRINKGSFKNSIAVKIEKERVNLDERLKLDAYMSLGEDRLDEDLGQIYRVSQYLRSAVDLGREISSPELSYRIVGDEKWIDFKGGMGLLQRIGAWTLLNVVYKPDPLMIAVNRKMLEEKSHLHLVVENKATYYDCLEILGETVFTSLVYGVGWKIVSNIDTLYRQLGVEKADSKLFYFGDLDYEGISIWSLTNERQSICPAVPFYCKLLEKEAFRGKQGQRKNMEALRSFKKHFDSCRVKSLEKLLEGGCYYPQEVISREEIRSIWIDTDWDSML